MVDSHFVLLVEDDAFCLQAAKAPLNNLKLAFDTATNGEDAIAKFTAKNGGITIVLMDLSMPVMDGFQATSKIREIEKSKGLNKCKIYALTADEDQETKDKATEIGMNGCIIKPLNINKINSIL